MVYNPPKKKKIYDEDTKIHPLQFYKNAHRMLNRTQQSIFQIRGVAAVLREIKIDGIVSDLYTNFGISSLLDI
jgi:hypothetical protein